VPLPVGRLRCRDGLTRPLRVSRLRATGCRVSGGKRTKFRNKVKI